MLRDMQQRPGPRPYDVTSRTLLEGDPVSWLTWIGLPVNGPVAAVDSDVSTVLADVDKVLRVDAPSPWLAHVELQSSRDPRLPLRLLQYHALLLRRHELPVESTVILLRPAADDPAMSGHFEQHGVDGNLTITFRFRVVRLWERPVDELLGGGLGVLPLAPLAAVDPAAVPDVMRRLDERLTRETDPTSARDLWAATLLLLGLRYDDEEIRRLVGTMSWVRDSATYRVLVEEGRIEGRAEGRIEGRVEEARRVIRSLGTRKLGPPDAATTASLDALDDVETLERLIDGLLTASTWRELLASASDR